MSKCYYHSNSEAIGQCTVCGKMLCKDCFDLTVGHLCYDCAQTLNANNKRNCIKSMIWTILLIVAWIVAIIIINTARDNGFYIAMGILIVLGFKPVFMVLKNLFANWFATPGVFIGLIIFKWLLIIILSALLAVFMILYYIPKFIYDLVKYRKEAKNFKLVEEAHKELMNQ